MRDPEVVRGILRVGEGPLVEVRTLPEACGSLKGG